MLKKAAASSLFRDALSSYYFVFFTTDTNKQILNFPTLNASGQRLMHATVGGSTRGRNSHARWSINDGTW